MAISKTSKTWVIASILVFFLLVEFVSAQAPWPGSGTEGDPYQIRDANDLNALGADPNYYSAHFKLISDVNLSGFTYTTAVIAPARTATYPFDGTPFTGVFDGNDYVIANLDIDTAGASNYFLGLFGEIASGATIENLGIVNASITGGTSSNYISGLAGWNDYATIRQCYSTVTLTGRQYLGGLVGINYRGDVTDCYSSGSVSGDSDVGGLVGVNNNGTISKCYSSGAVFGSFSVGGLVGKNTQSGSISRCYSTGPVSGSSSVGGLVGQSSSDIMDPATVSQCYSTGAVFGNSTVGGLVGYIYETTISQCYSTGAVSGETSVGGLVGYRMSGGAGQSYWDEWTSGQTSSMGGTGKTTFEMKQQATYTGWDFVDTWYIVEDAIYPIHSWTLTFYRGDLNLDGYVNFFDFAIMAEHWLQY